MRRVVITGLGIFSSIGNGVDEVARSLREGKSGIGLSKERLALGYRSGLMGMLPEIDVKDVLDRKSRLRFAEHGVYEYIAVKEALKMAGMDDAYLKSNEVGIIMGNDSSAKAVIEGVDIIREKHLTQLVGSGNVFQVMNSTLSMNLAVSLGIKGVSFTVSAACSSSSHAIGLATTLIRSGIQERIICGGAQEVNEFSVGSFDGIAAFSTRMDEPTKASRPFDMGRDGLVPSGGGAAVIVESMESALSRGATILGEIVGYGVSTSGEHLTIPTSEGPYTAMKRAIEDAGMEVSDIDYINAHATSTKIGDANEAEAIVKLMGEWKPLVTSTKSMTGHELWMAGASEIVYSTLMMNEGFVAPNINLEEKDPKAVGLDIPTKVVEKKIDAYLSNSFGFGGTNAALVVKKI
ncbi:MAG: beta-ketoacyl-[acyl-carrier-protein] synthase family protein [Bacteroidales bacterium]|nr:beta-ketoacyl-[acyl-carrier-protein] synthase family protein [Bacteroidales bacterium]